MGRRNVVVVVAMLLQPCLAAFDYTSGGAVTCEYGDLSRLNRFAGYGFSLKREGGKQVLYAGSSKEGCMDAIANLEAAADAAHTSHASLYLSCHKYPGPLYVQLPSPFSFPPLPPSPSPRPRYLLMLISSNTNDLRRTVRRRNYVCGGAWVSVPHATRATSTAATDFT